MPSRRSERLGSSVRCVALLATAIVVAACGGSTSTDVSDHAEAGTYTLLTVNGQSLPVTITGTSLGTVVIRSATVILNAGSALSYTAAVTGSVSGAPSAPFLNDAGSYVRSGSTLTFTSSVAPISYSGTYNSSTGHVTVALPGAAIGVANTLQLELAK